MLLIAEPVFFFVNGRGNPLLRVKSKVHISQRTLNVVLKQSRFSRVVHRIEGDQWV